MVTIGYWPILLFIFFIAFLLLGFPIAFSLSVPCLIYLVFNDINPLIIPERMLHGANSFTLVAVPFFIFAGQIMNSGGITTRIFALSKNFVGHIPGGLAHVNIVGSMIFAGMSGSALADASGLGLVEIKAMIDDGFDADFSAAVTAASSLIGPIIPPSIPFIIYGAIAEVSVGRLFLGGFLPGVFMGVSLMVAVYIWARKKHLRTSRRPPAIEIWRNCLKGIPTLLMPVFILGSIASGFCSATEAGIIAAAYGLLLGLVYHEIGKRNFFVITLEAIENTAVIMFVVSSAALFGWILTREGIPIMIGNYFLATSKNPLLFLLIINILLLFLGCIMETITIMLLITPIVMPVIKTLGIDPVHFGVVMVLNLMIGLITPPFGMVLFVLTKITNLGLDVIFRKTVPFLIPLVLVLLLITYVPGIVLLIPNYFFGK